MSANSNQKSRKLGALFLVVFVGIAASIGCDEEGNLLIDEDEAVSQLDRAVSSCSIVLGENGNSKTITVSLSSGGTYSNSSIGGAWSFVRSTSGPCHFKLYNSTSFGGDHVTYGSNISERVRVGTDGFTKKDDGGGDTWRARSIKISYPSANLGESCAIRVGDNGVSMDVYASIPDLPLSAFVRTTKGRNCRYTLHSGSSYGGSRYKYAFPGIDSNFRVGYYMRSIGVKSWTQSYCPVRAATGSDAIPLGRCLPIAYPPSSMSSYDGDSDGLADAFESWMAKTFSPIFVHDSDLNSEVPKLLYQVASLNSTMTKLRIKAGLLWTEDKGYGPSSSCNNDHNGDYSGLTVEVKRGADASGNYYYYPVKVDLWHHAHWENGVAWDKQWDSDKGGGNRGFDFSGARPLVFLSAHKHHTYNDTGWNHQDSAYSSAGCNDDVDGDGIYVTASYWHVGTSAHPLITSIQATCSSFYNYNFWTSTKDFCGSYSPGSNDCSGTVLSQKPFTD